MEDESKLKDTHSRYTESYTNILDTYKEKISSSIDKKNELKEKFFNTIKNIMHWLTWIFAITLILSLIIFALMVYKNYQSIAIVTGAVATIISSFSTMIISIFKLPEIIANYLFNKEEDNLMNEIIKNIQQYEIEAVKYEIERVKLEKIKELNSEVPGSDTNDNDLVNSTYQTPPTTIISDIPESNKEDASILAS